MPGSEGGAAPVFVFRSLLLATSLEVGRETAQRRKPGPSPTGGTDGTASPAWHGLGHHLGDSTQRPGPGQASGLGEQTDFDLLPLAAEASKAEQPGEGGWREAEGPGTGRRGGLTPCPGEPAYPPPTPRFPVKRQTTWTNQLPNRFPTGIPSGHSSGHWERKPERRWVHASCPHSGTPVCDLPLALNLLQQRLHQSTGSRAHALPKSLGRDTHHVSTGSHTQSGKG